MKDHLHYVQSGFLGKGREEKSGHGYDLDPVGPFRKDTYCANAHVPTEKMRIIGHSLKGCEDYMRE